MCLYAALGIHGCVKRNRLNAWGKKVDMFTVKVSSRTSVSLPREVALPLLKRGRAFVRAYARFIAGSLA